MPEERVKEHSRMTQGGGGRGHATQKGLRRLIVDCGRGEGGEKEIIRYWGGGKKGAFREKAVKQRRKGSMKVKARMRIPNIKSQSFWRWALNRKGPGDRRASLLHRKGAEGGVW